MTKNKNRVISFALVLLMCLALLPKQTEAASLLGTSIRGDSAKFGTYYNGGKYNFHFAWVKYPNDRYNYRLTVRRVSDGKWVIITSLPSGNPKRLSNGTYYYEEDIYGLRPDKYEFYISAYDSNYRVIDTHFGTRITVTSNGAQLTGWF